MSVYYYHIIYLSDCLACIDVYWSRSAHASQNCIFETVQLCTQNRGALLRCYLLALLDKINAEIDFHDIGKQGNFSKSKVE